MRLGLPGGHRLREPRVEEGERVGGRPGRVEGGQLDVPYALRRSSVWNGVAGPLPWGAAGGGGVPGVVMRRL